MSGSGKAGEDDDDAGKVFNREEKKSVSWTIDMGDGGDGRGVVETAAGGGKASLAARRSAQLPKLKDIQRRNKGESFDDGVGAEPDLDFTYGDCDSYATELAELYTYSEVPEFDQNAVEFSNFILRNHFPQKKWTEWERSQKSLLVQTVLEELELADKDRRLNSLKVILYLLQGNFNDCEEEKTILRIGLENVYLLYENGVFAQLCEALATEIEVAKGDELGAEISEAYQSNEKASIDGNKELRSVLAAIYHFVEGMREDHWDDVGMGNALSEEERERTEKLRKNFRIELGSPLVGDQTLGVALFKMIITFCAGVGARFPMRKVLLLLWKTLLTWLGGWEELREMKIVKRREAGLTKGEDTILVASTMRSAAPPQVLSLITGGQGGMGGEGEGVNRRSRPPLAKRQLACSSTDDDGSQEEDNPFDGKTEGLESGGAGFGESTPRPGSPTEQSEEKAEAGKEALNQAMLITRSFAWAPKIRPQEVEAFLESERLKFFGYSLPGDKTSTAGFPQPIKESVNALRRHLYVSLGDVQAEKEGNLNKYFFSQKEHIPECPTEELYRQLLPELPQHMIALLKLLLSAFPSTVAKTDVITILSDCVPPDLDPAILSNSMSLSDDAIASGAAASISGLEASLRLSIDVKRHKEVIVKATSAILILLVKHFRLNHIYQFEFMSQHLVFANCIPLILKFFDQNIQSYIQSRNELPALNYPIVLLNPLPQDLGLENMEYNKDSNNMKGYFLWRNLFSAINQLRLLNKLTKWKHARTMMLVVFKSAPIMKRALRVRHILLQLFALKILKMQSKHLGRQWRKTNMELMSAIYSKVRHRLNDDWAYGNETQSKAFDFQAEESQLRSGIEVFHLRRYGSSLASSTAMSSMSGSGGGIGGSDGPVHPSSKSLAPGSPLLQIGKENFHDPEFEPYDHNIVSVLGTEYKLTERFKVNYEKWLEQEVFKASIDWDELLANNRGSTAVSA